MNVQMFHTLKGLHQHNIIDVTVSSYLQALSAVVPAAVVGAARPLVVTEAQSIETQHTSHTVAHQAYLLGTIYNLDSLHIWCTQSVKDFARGQFER